RRGRRRCQRGVPRAYPPSARRGPLDRRSGKVARGGVDPSARRPAAAMLSTRVLENRHVLAAAMTRIALLSTSDTDLLSARASGAEFALGNPARIDVTGDGPGGLPALTAGADVIVVRILGSARSWQEGLDAVQARGVPVV